MHLAILIQFHETSQKKENIEFGAISIQTVHNCNQDTLDYSCSFKYLIFTMYQNSTMYAVEHCSGVALEAGVIMLFVGYESTTFTACTDKI